MEITLAPQRVVWHHNPPKANHYAELFQAAVGSCKRYVKKMLSVANLPYEEFHTTVYCWEAILNSRSLYPLTDNSSDLQLLTSAYFLIQRVLNMPPMGKELKEDLPATKQ